jgi:predicted metal-dependent hydrolase
MKHNQVFLYRMNWEIFKGILWRSSRLGTKNMTELLRFKNYELVIRRRARQRNLNLRVRRDGVLSVSCAIGVPRYEIFKFLGEQENFIQRALHEYALERAKFLQMVWSWNERIRVAHSEAEIEMTAPLTSSVEERKAALFKYYRKLAKSALIDEVHALSLKMGLRPSAVSVRGQKTRWGSCSSRGELSLNWKLMAVPPSVREYVLVHELAHLRHMNHSPKFWALVAEHYPNFKNAKRWLREHEAELGIQFQKISNSL